MVLRGNFVLASTHEHLNWKYYLKIIWLAYLNVNSQVKHEKNGSQESVDGVHELDFEYSNRNSSNNSEDKETHGQNKHYSHHAKNKD